MKTLITGANDGIGKETAKALAKKGHTILMICRNQGKGLAAAKEIKAFAGHDQVELYIADLADQAQIRNVVHDIRSDHDYLDVLVNNAGFMGYLERQTTVDGIESTLAVNHLAPFMLTHLLFPLLKNQSNSRIVNVSSVVHQIGKLDRDNLEWGHSYKAFKAYCQTKLMNVLFTRELAKRIAPHGVTANSLDPGKVATTISKTYSPFFRIAHKIGTPFLLTPAQGAKTSIYLASADEVSGVSGKYFAKSRQKEEAHHAQNDDDALWLWNRSLEYTGLQDQSL
ncbi:MAG: SDR family oxidoreductase [Bacteroidota bacterium]